MQKLRTWKDCEQWLWEVAEREAERWYKKAVANPFGRFYLYYTKGNALVAEEAPEGYHLAWQERISPASTQEQVKRFIYEKLRRCPCLPEQKEGR